MTTQAPDRVSPDKFWALALLRMIDNRTVRPSHASTVKDSFESNAEFETRAARLRDGLACANCAEIVSSPAIYCDELCGQTAAAVRYARKHIAAGRSGEADFHVGLGTLLISLFKGGYRVKSRSLSRERRQAIFARDERICRLCGNPADQIDHVSGDSSDPSNLRAVCGPCNRLLAMTPMREPTSDERAEFIQRAGDVCFDLAERVSATQPGRCCDDHERWKASEPRIRAIRHRRLREIEDAAESDFEDVDGYLEHAMQKND